MKAILKVLGKKIVLQFKMRNSRITFDQNETSQLSLGWLNIPPKAGHFGHL